MLKVEYCCSTRSAPQRGQTGGGWFRPSTSFSNTFPHFWQAYSKIGMAVSRMNVATARYNRSVSLTGRVAAALR